MVLRKNFESPMGCEEDSVNSGTNLSQPFIEESNITVGTLMSYVLRRLDSLEKNLMLGKMNGKRRIGQQRTRWVNTVIEAKNKSRDLEKSCEVEGLGKTEFMGSQGVCHG